jgi:hypothetical protein
VVGGVGGGGEGYYNFERSVDVRILRAPQRSARIGIIIVTLIPDDRRAVGVTAGDYIRGREKRTVEKTRRQRRGGAGYRRDRKIKKHPNPTIVFIRVRTQK